MKYDLLIKCFIAFCVGAIIYKFISDRCSCNLLEGQSGEEENSVPPTDPTTPDIVIPETVTIDVPVIDATNFMNTINQEIFIPNIKDSIKNIIIAIPTDKFSENELPSSIDSVSTFEQFGSNSLALDYLELIVIEISNLDINEFQTFINNLFPPDYCDSDEDLNAYIISILLIEYYSIKVDTNLTQEYINISNRLSKYIPDILDKVQRLNKMCEGTNKQIKSTIIDTMIYRLFKNNNTIINIGSLDSLVNELNKLDRVYGVVILLCITYIIVRFFGVFNMKMEV